MNLFLVEWTSSCGDPPSFHLHVSCGTVKKRDKLKFFPVSSRLGCDIGVPPLVAGGRVRVCSVAVHQLCFQAWRRLWFGT